MTSTITNGLESLTQLLTQARDIMTEMAGRLKNPLPLIQFDQGTTSIDLGQNLAVILDTNQGGTPLVVMNLTTYEGIQKVFGATANVLSDISKAFQARVTCHNERNLKFRGVLNPLSFGTICIVSVTILEIFQEIKSHYQPPAECKKHNTKKSIITWILLGAASASLLCSAYRIRALVLNSMGS